MCTRNCQWPDIFVNFPTLNVLTFVIIPKFLNLRFKMNSLAKDCSTILRQESKFGKEWCWVGLCVKIVVFIDEKGLRMNVKM